FNLSHDQTLQFKINSALFKTPNLAHQFSDINFSNKLRVISTIQSMKIISINQPVKIHTSCSS
ncbi:hypothetical protein WCE14_03125, partial [Acinetobacter schindleri]|uniref:hypothetical protein n=1 Tax=Acinetobacter schindleri TaxID=108981 RepID=UPI0034D76551